MVIPQRWYCIALRKYCRQLGIPEIGTHGLRHSTSEIYLSHGASRDDLRQLFAHSSLKVTDRYVRDKASNLEKVSNVILLGLPSQSSTKIVHVDDSEGKAICKELKLLGWVRGIEPPTPRVTVWDTPKTDVLENTALTQK